MVYTEDFRTQAIELVEQIGVPKASKQLHVGEMTLRTWRKKAYAKQQQKNKEKIDSERPKDEENLQNLQIDLRRELEEQKRLNTSCQQTIQYLVDENTALRQRCEYYLQAISLISQR